MCIECLHQSNGFVCHSAVKSCLKSLSFRAVELFKPSLSHLFASANGEASGSTMMMVDSIVLIGFNRRGLF